MMRYHMQPGMAVSETVTVYGHSNRLPVYALASGLNALALDGVVRAQAEMQLVVPPSVPGEWLGAAEREFRSICNWKGVTVSPVRIRKNPMAAVPCAVVTVLACGEDLPEEKQVCPGCEIVLAGWTGMEGMLRILEEREAELGQRFSRPFLERIREYETELFLGERFLKEDREEILYGCQIADGGVLAALWNLARDLRAGLNLDLKMFPLLQETIEVCEYYRINPYQLTSAGAFLLAVEDGAALAERMGGRGIPCSVIGRVTDNRDKIIRNGEEIRYIDRPAPDEMWKVLEIEKGDGS